MKRVLAGVSTILLSFVILFISIYRSSVPSYSFVFETGVMRSGMDTTSGRVRYSLPSDANLSPKSVVWNIRGLFDRFRLVTESDPMERARLALEHADYRLASVSSLVVKGDYESAVVVLERAEGYLELSAAQTRLVENPTQKDYEFMEELAMAALKHTEIMEDSLLAFPEEARPYIVQTMDYSKGVFHEMSTSLQNAPTQRHSDSFESES